MPPCVAVIEVVPAPKPVARPELAPMVATELFEEAQTTAELMSWMLVSLYVPVAVNHCEVPCATVALGGITAMDFRDAEVTVNVAAGLLRPPRVAFICAEPALMPRASPDPGLTVATLLLEELHVAVVVTFCVLPSLKVPKAVNCWVPSLARDAVMGRTAIDWSVAEVPVSVPAGLTTLPSVAVIRVVPEPWPTARPVCEPIVATAGFAAAQVTSEEMSCVVPSLKVPVAVNCCVPPGASEALAGVTAMDCSVAVVTASVAAGLTRPVCAEPEPGPREMGEPVA